MGVTEDGTGYRLRHNYGKNFYRNKAVTGYPYEFTNEIAGKTGTTQNNSDGWFMGAPINQPSELFCVVPVLPAISLVNSYG